MKKFIPRCEDDEWATKMACYILQELGYSHVIKGPNIFNVEDEISHDTLHNIARYAEHIARWARKEMKSK